MLEATVMSRAARAAVDDCGRGIGRLLSGRLSFREADCQQVSSLARALTQFKSRELFAVPRTLLAAAALFQSSYNRPDAFSSRDVSRGVGSRLARFSGG